jgi:hypothetical protein
MTEIPMIETELFIKKVLVIWSLEFGYCLLFGAWCLEFKEIKSVNNARNSYNLLYYCFYKTISTFVCDADAPLIILSQKQNSLKPNQRGLPKNWRACLLIISALQ